MNLYFSSTGNTEKIARTIAATASRQGHSVENIAVKMSMGNDPDLLSYDLVFVGSGVYEWLPGAPLMSLFSRLAKHYRKEGVFEQPAARRPGKRAVVYCSYGGTHTGRNEAVPTVKYLGQLFDHLGFEISGEWYLVGEFHGAFSEFSKTGKLGDISGRPDEKDLRDLAEMVKGILKVGENAA